MDASQKIHLHFHDIDQSRFPLSEREVASWLVGIALDHQHPIHNMDYVFCSDDHLLEMNQRHLGHDYLTDILTFPYDYNPVNAEIYISLDRVIDNANDLGCPMTDELLRVLAHGLLHMIGYNDKTPAEKKAMSSAEDKAIRKFQS